jgi:hypothetical protein
MSDQPTTPSGRLMLAYSDPAYLPTIRAIEREAAESEAAKWRRLPGSYRLEDGSVEVIVDVPESAAFLLDEYPDEVALIQRQAAESAQAQLHARLRKAEAALTPGRISMALCQSGVISKRDQRSKIELPRRYAVALLAALDWEADSNE